MIYDYLTQALSIVLMVFFFGFCVFIHEFGHLLAAMWRKLHIERFSIGFGNAIWKKTIKGIEYRISWIPFGGYVALPQLEPTDEPEAFDGEKLPEAKPLDRIITAFAGPLFNIIFGFALGLVVMLVGMQQVAPSPTVTVGFLPSSYDDPGTGETKLVPEFKAGLRLGDEIVAVNGTTLVTNGMREARDLILEEPNVELDVVRDGKKLKINYKASSHPNPDFRGAGVPMFMEYHPSMLGVLEKTSAAYKCGLREDDVVLEINGKKAWSSAWIASTLRELNPDPKPNADYVDATFLIKRDNEDEPRKIVVTPDYIVPTKKNKLKKPAVLFGLYAIPKFKKELTYPSPWKHFKHVFVMMGKTMKMISDKDNPVGVQALSGPVGIANMMKRMFDAGIIHGLYITVIISFSLAIFNLLPLPILDGGHISIALVEMIARRKVPTKVLRPVFYAFFAVIISFALYVTFFDVRQMVTKDYILRQTTTKEDAVILKRLAAASEKTSGSVTTDPGSIQKDDASKQN